MHLSMRCFSFALSFFSLARTAVGKGPGNSPSQHPYKKTCFVKPGPNGTDDAIPILKAFQDCGHDGHIILSNGTFHIESTMNTTGLKNCDIDIHGTMLWGTNTTYWVQNSMPYGYQNQSSAWWLGGDNIHVRGFGYGTLDGNGQTWYNFAVGVSNYPGRPQAITIWKATNSIIEGLRLVQSQMWSMTVIHSEDVLLQDMYVNNTSHDSCCGARNTDGLDTMFSNNIHINRWTIVNGDDSISTKANSTNILVTNCTFYNGLGFALGSIGQYKDSFETLENITVRDIIAYNTLHAAYVKTWTGQQVGYPPNGGGGGFGYAKNITFENFKLYQTRGPPFSISQCTTFSGVAGDCNSSLFQLEDFNISNITGTIVKNPITSFSCSSAAPCHDISMTGVELTIGSSSTLASGWNCANVVDTFGFNCTGSACQVGTSTGSCPST